jgi:phenylalanyl-tRNA synthetase alpha chain
LESQNTFASILFPFTEQVLRDIYWGLKQKLIIESQRNRLVRNHGCGMVDLMFLKRGINPEEYNGFAFGMGIERIAMLLYQIGDIRMFYENDVRFRAI